MSYSNFNPKILRLNTDTDSKDFVETESNSLIDLKNPENVIIYIK